METYITSREWLLIVGLFALSPLTSWSAETEEPALTWRSPQGQYEMVHCPALWLVAHNERCPECPYVYVLTHRSVVVWTGMSFVDESAHAFKVIWSPRLDFVLVLDRPERGECYLNVIALKPGYISRAPSIQNVVRDAFKASEDTDDRVAAKQWFGRWTWVSRAVARGELYCSKRSSYKITLEYNAGPVSEGLRVLETKILKTGPQ